MAMMMADCVGFQAQIASIIELLANSAVLEICKLVDDGYAALRSQMELEREQSEKENEDLRRRLRDMDVRVRSYERKLKRRNQREEMHNVHYRPPEVASTAVTVAEGQGPLAVAEEEEEMMHHMSQQEETLVLPQVKQERADCDLNLKVEVNIRAETASSAPRSDIIPVVGNVLDEEEASSLWRPECGSSAKDDDSTSSAVTELEKENPAHSADSVTAALEISSSSGLGPTRSSLDVIIKEEDGTPYQGYGDCAVMSQAIQVSRQQDHQDGKGEPSDLPVTPQYPLPPAKMAAVPPPFHQLHTYQLPLTSFRRIQPSVGPASRMGGASTQPPPPPPYLQLHATQIPPPPATSVQQGAKAVPRMLYPRRAMAVPPRPFPLVPAALTTRLLMLPSPALGPSMVTSDRPAVGTAAPVKRQYHRTVTSNTCRKCGQFRTQETGHSQHKGRIYCPNTETVTKDQWLEMMRR